MPINFEFDKAESPWHHDGVKISYDGEDKTLIKRMIHETRPSWDEEQIEQAKKRIYQNGKIVSTDVTGDAAFVKLIWDFQMDDERREITDYILLLKIEEEWKIVGKVFNEKVIGNNV
ncbi:MAG: nuclear transport factor 2 family protein [Candidatus Thorarchaeota archaeon]|jgi:hypothetical protein